MNHTTIYYTTLFVWLYMRLDILLTCVMYSRDHIISLRRDIWAHKISLTPTLFIEVPVSSQGREW
jgi:hypothetical protein